MNEQAEADKSLQRERVKFYRHIVRDNLRRLRNPRAVEFKRAAQSGNVIAMCDVPEGSIIKRIGLEGANRNEALRRLAVFLALHDIWGEVACLLSVPDADKAFGFLVDSRSAAEFVVKELKAEGQIVNPRLACKLCRIFDGI